MIIVHGRRKYYDHLTDFRKVSKSRYTVKRNGVEYQIEGGRHAGGTSREWWVDTAEWNGKPIDCTSLVDALQLIDRM